MVNSRKYGTRTRATIEMKIVPTGKANEYTVRGIHRGGLYEHGDDPFGRVALDSRDGRWYYTSAHNPGAGPVYGRGHKTKELAAAECYRNHRSWVGF